MTKKPEVESNGKRIARALLAAGGAATIAAMGIGAPTAVAAPGAESAAKPTTQRVEVNLDTDLAGLKAEAARSRDPVRSQILQAALNSAQRGDTNPSLKRRFSLHFTLIIRI